MLLLPSIFHGMLGMLAIGVIAFSLMIFPQVFAENTWKITITEETRQKMENITFQPAELPVEAGDSIEWINKDTQVHSIVSGVPGHEEYFGHFFSSGDIKPGESVTIKVSDEYFAYYYLCQIHPWMTGKFFLSSTIEAIPEVENPIYTSQQSYQNEQKIDVKGQVHQDFWGSEYEILVYDQDNELVNVKQGIFDEESQYSDTIFPDENWNESGQYKVKLVYGLPSKVAQTTFEFVNNPDTLVPEWVKNVGQFWCNEQIDDSDFVNSMQHLISKGVIKIDNIGDEKIQKQEIPEWVKNSTCWWSEDKISDEDFVSGIEYLINKGTIRL